MQRILIALVFVSATDTVAGQTTFAIGAQPSKRVQSALPLAKCIWKQRYADALMFSDELEKGLSAKVALDRLGTLQQSCPTIRVQGDLIGAIVHNRQTAVGDCLQREAPQSYRTFRKTTNRDTAAAKQFVEKGFPAGLKAAAARCDITLTDDVAVSERADFGVRVLGWQ